MGEAKTRLQRMQRDQAWCIYCGGTTLGASVDHMPPIAIFTGRHRPKGMEYLACVACHNGSRKLDLLAGLLCRMYPDPKTPKEQQEVSEYLAGISNNFPALLSEMSTPPEHEDAVPLARLKFPDVDGVIGVGPVMRMLLGRFSGRVGLALHYELCREIVSPDGGVFVRVHSNASLVDGTFPSDFTAMLGEERTLHQGSKTVDDQFSYSSKATENRRMSAHVAVFRMSFAVQVFVAQDFSDLAPAVQHPDRAFRPGFLKDVFSAT